MEYEIIRVDDKTWRIENGFVRFFLLEGNEKAILIDSGVTVPNAKGIAESLTGLPVELINTHGDGDHTSGNAAFSSFYMHPADYDGCKIHGKFPGSVLNPILDGQMIDPGGRPLEIIAIPGHTRGSVAILDIQHRSLYAGDSVQAHMIYMFGAHRSPDSFADSLLKLRAMQDRFDVIYSSHGKADLPPSFIDTVYDTWQQVLGGSLKPVKEILHGNQVLSYHGSDCGFYC